MLLTGTIVPVTMGESGRLTRGHELVVVTVLSTLAVYLSLSISSTYDVLQLVLHLFATDSGAGAAAARPTAANRERLKVNFIVKV